MSKEFSKEEKQGLKAGVTPTTVRREVEKHGKEKVSKWLTERERYIEEGGRHPDRPDGRTDWDAVEEQVQRHIDKSGPPESPYDHPEDDPYDEGD